MKKFVLTLMLAACAVVLAQAGGLRAYNLPEGGYVVLDGQDEIVAVGERGTTADMSAELLTFLGEKSIPVAGDLPKAFAKRELVIVDSVGPLLGDIMFDQSAPYNRQTPMLKGQHCLTGCVATAMAQIMTYYKYPEQCKPGTVKYTSGKNSIEVTYTFDGVTFDWSKIRHTYIPGAGHDYTEEEADEVAKLMAACGAAVEMDYGLEGSGSLSQLVPNALVTYFGYHIGLEFENKSDFLTDNDFHAAMIDEFKAGRPVYTSGANGEGGHAYVMDGYMTYQGAEAYPLFHFNWGWNGAGNEWVTFKKSEHNQSASFIRFIRPDNGTAVDNVQNNVVVSGIYDILGNRVSEMVPGNIYIVNGKKILAR